MTEQWQQWFVRYEEFERAFSEEILALRRGLADSADTAAIMESYADLYEKKWLDDAHRHYEEAKAEEKEVWRRVWFTLLGTAIYGELAKAADELSSAQLAAKTRWRGKDLPYFSIPATMETLENAAEREELDAKRRALVADFIPLQKQLQSEEERLLQQYGFGGSLDYLQQKKRVDYDAFLVRLDQVVAATDEMYQKAMGDWVKRELGMDFAATPSKCHTAVLHRYRWTVDHFDADHFDAISRKRFAAMGLDLFTHEAIQVDIEDRPKKNPRACVIPVQVPNEVWLLTRPKGTYDDYAAFFHEAGHALHYAHSDPGLPYPFRSMGVSHALTEFYSFLIQNSTVDAAWLGEAFDFDVAQARQFEQELVLFDLFMFRRYVAKLRYELTDLKGQSDDPASLYAETLTHYTGFRYESIDYLSDRDDGLYSADYLRAWVGERQLDGWLRREVGHDWHGQEATGNKLKAIWQLGDKPDAEELIASLGMEPWDTSPLLDWYRNILG